ncbi:MAG TPA: hypothetical protein VI032_20430 [Burkholderiaceae bacterium]
MPIATRAGVHRSNRWRLVVPAAALIALLGTAQAQSRWVFVNGQRMTDAQVRDLARIQCSEIPDGHYWLNPVSGAWGYMGNPTVQGVLGDACRGGGPGGGVNLDGTRGPFATLRRAEEVASQFRAQGLRAVAFHNGDGYYVRVSR